MKSYDVIVIGAGHNGLIAASKLAASGRRVLLLEAGDTYGGMARSEVLFEGFLAPELASNAGGISKDVVQDLGLNKYDLLFNRPIPGYAQYRSPIKGLYMCGSSTHPGGGVMGAPGRNAAVEILKDLNLPDSDIRDAYEVL